jgi:putative ABC transport system ATP-binding protein
MPSDPPVLAVRGVNKTYDDGTPVRAVRGATFTLEPGQFAAIKGPSGCGKSVLFALIAGLEAADDGQIAVAGVAVTDCGEAARLELRRRQVGMLGTDARLLGGLSVLANVALAATVGGASPDVAEARGHELLDLVGLGDVWRSPPARLSPVQRQRAALARALANRPALLLADEPTGRLDSNGRRELLDLVRRLHAAGQSVLLGTHDDEVAAAADRIIAMRDGRLIEPAASRLLPTTEPASHGRVVL